MDTTWTQTQHVEFTIETVPLPPRRPKRVRKSRAGIKRPSTSPWTEATTFLCPNCDERWHPPSMRPWYCSLRCSAEADAVRYARAKLAEYPDGLPEDIEDAVIVNLAHARVGGYDKQARRLSPETRAAVWERDAGCCVKCDEPGEEIDHNEGSSSELANLRLLCKPCHAEITWSHIYYAGDLAAGETEPELPDPLLQRIFSKEAVRPCDDANWNQVRAQWRRANTQFG